MLLGNVQALVLVAHAADPSTRAASTSNGPSSRWTASPSRAPPRWTSPAAEMAECPDPLRAGVGLVPARSGTVLTIHITGRARHELGYGSPCHGIDYQLGRVRSARPKETTSFS